MIYPYFCKACDQDFDVIKRVADIDQPEHCRCGHLAERRIALVRIAMDEGEGYNPAFGCIVKSKAHKRELLAVARGNGREMIEVGNEPAEKIHAHFDKQRADRMRERWNEPTEKVMQEALR